MGLWGLRVKTKPYCLRTKQNPNTPTPYSPKTPPKSESLILPAEEPSRPDNTYQVPIEVRADPRSMYAGAIGAALWGAYRKERLEALDTTAAAPTGP